MYRLCRGLHKNGRAHPTASKEALVAYVVAGLAAPNYCTSFTPLHKAQAIRRCLQEWASTSCPPSSYKHQRAYHLLG